MPFDINSSHDSVSDLLEELAASFAIGSLDPLERADYESHISICSVCETLVSDSALAAELLTEALPQRESTPGLKSRILAEIAADAAPAELSSIDRDPGGMAHKPRVARLTQGLVAAAAIAAIAVLVVWNISLSNQIDDRADQLERQIALAISLDPDARIVGLVGTEAAPDSIAVLVQGDTKSFLIVHDLAPLGSAQEYQLWRIEGSTLIPRDTFQHLNNEERVILLAGDLGDAPAFGISIEPAGGSPSGAPTGAVVLLSPA